MAPAVFLARCRYCSKWHNPRDFIVNPAVGYCLDCYQWNQRALEMLATGDAPPGCQVCGASYAAIEMETGRPRMFLHRKDGIYQILCPKCSDAYERKRADVFRATPYGAARGI